MDKLTDKIQKMHEEWLKASQIAMAATRDEQKAKCIAADKFSVQVMEMIPEIVQLIRELEEEKQKNALRWTKEAPTRSGWYFIRGDVVVAQPVHNKKNVVYLNAEEDIIVYGHRAPWRISETLKKYTVEFVGPIQEPVE